ncbi:alpha/beta fold hydrolase, partial [Streptomyces sp. CAU 1734]|uniref:alpha/beta hydrolase n=1 Tax=Streptomyces sp. CAU 1734 TaxID=3140360 RepID=UPI003260D102
TLSALTATPRHTPRAVIVALHGVGMSAGYFDNRARPGLSLLTLGAQLGHTVIAPDRPGYGASATALPRGQNLGDQSDTLHTALARYAETHPTGAGFFLLAHSGGARLALAAAADPRAARVIGLDLSGIGTRLAAAPHQLPGPARRGDWRRHWGSLRLYPPGALRLGGQLVRPVPALEAAETPAWPARYPRLAARVTAPVRFTFAEQERWWHHDPAALRELLAPLASPRAEAVRLPDAGHNISLGWAARTYHLRALAFLEECLLTRDAADPSSTLRTTAGPRTPAAPHPPHHLTSP